MKGTNVMTEDKLILISYFLICAIICILLVKGYIG